MLGIQQLGRSSSDITKYVQKAEKALQKGRLKSALSQYLQVLQLDPGNAGAKESVAEVYISLNQPTLAAEQLSELFHFYAQKHNLPKATLTYKRLARLRPTLPDEALLFAQLNEKENLREALLAYEAALNGYRTLCRDEEVFEILGRLTKLDPTAERFQQLADVSIRLGRMREAAIAYTGMALEFQRHGVDASSQFARAYALDATNAVAALGHGSALLESNPAQAMQILEPLANYPSSPAEAREPYGIALMRAQHPLEAEPYIWEMFQRDPRRALEKVIELAGHMLDVGQESRAVDLSRRLEEFQRRVGLRREFVALMRKMVEKRQLGTVFLEYLATLYDSANHEADLTATLGKLFEDYVAEGDFERATAALERAVDVDVYEGEHRTRLELLQGKVDAVRLSGLQHRLSGIRTTAAAAAEQEQEAQPAAADDPAAVEDLLVEAELFCRYALMAQAASVVRKIRERFPSEENTNDRLRELCVTLGFQLREKPVAGEPVSVAPPLQSVGMLKRSQYLDAVLTEVTRAKEQRKPLALALLDIEMQETALNGDSDARRELMQRAGEAVCAHLRHGDTAVRYGATQIAVLLGNTSTGGAAPAVDRIKQVVQKACGGSGCSPSLTAGVAEARLDPAFAVVDIATEMINRVEAALEKAKTAEAETTYLAAGPTEMIARTA